MRFRSEGTTALPIRRTFLIAAALAAVLLVGPLVGAAADVINTGQFLIPEGAVQAEDAYVTSSSAVVEGTVDGDLVIATGSLLVTGTVTGDVIAAVRGRITIDGVVEGSLRGLARTVSVTGTVGDDVAVVAGQLDVPGSVGRDVIGLGGTARLRGTVGRDVKGRYVEVAVVGDVGRDVDVTVRDVGLEATAVVGGDVVYQASRDANVDPGASITGQVIKLPTDAPFYVGLVLDIALILGFLGYLAGGLVVLWLARRSGAHAVATALSRPGLALGVGSVMVVGLPLVLAVLVSTLVGIPLGVVLLLVIVIGVLFGSVPPVAALGVRVLGGRGGVYGGFLAGALAWWVVANLAPVAGAVLFVILQVWGAGSWVVGAKRARDGSMEGGVRVDATAGTDAGAAPSR